MGGAYGMHGREWFWWENMKERNNYEDVAVDWKIY
jgi:hypothetical protein